MGLTMQQRAVQRRLRVGAHIGLAKVEAREHAAEYPRARRLAILRRLLPATPQEIRDAYPHVWPSVVVERRGERWMESRLLNRDLHALGA
jgi:hypothetical protein